MRESFQVVMCASIVLLGLQPSVSRAALTGPVRAMRVDGTTILEGKAFGGPRPTAPLSATCIAVPFCDLQITPSTGACSGHAAVPRSRNITYFLYDSSSGQPIPNCPVAADYRPEQNTGGHCHTDPNRPVEYPPGTVPRVITGNTGADGLQFVVPNTWPEESGGIDVRFYSTDPGCAFYNDTTVSFILCVQVAQFGELGAAAGYDLTGTTPAHPSPNNHFGTVKLLAALPQLAADFSQAYPAVHLGYNDMSLPWGGVFDLNQDWKSSHCGHRVGTTVDVRINNLNKTQRKTLRALLRTRGFSIFFESDHWHCTIGA